jgi:hypothetical protein
MGCRVNGRGGGGETERKREKFVRSRNNDT